MRVWLRTGDIAAIDERGYIIISDRAKDVVKSGGEWISSVELENEIMAHPAVTEAAVIATPDERWGARPPAFVVTEEGAELTLEELREHLESRVATSSCPRSAGSAWPRSHSRRRCWSSRRCPEAASGSR